MTIKIIDTTFDALTLYRKANTPEQKALAGYIIKAGETCNPILGGAFKALRDIQHCMEVSEIYRLYSLVDPTTEKEIIHVAQMALDGNFDRFAISERERQTTIKALCEPM